MNYLQQNNQNYNNPDLQNLGAKVPAWADGAPNQQPAMNPNALAIGSTGGGSNAGGGSSIGGNSLDQWIAKQMAQNQQARQQNQQSFNDASGYLKQYANPLSPEVIGQMKTENATKAQAGMNNSLAEQNSMMAASGQGDAGSMAAAAQAANRHSLGAQIGANTDLGIKAAQINNQAGFNVGNSILNNIPQYRPDDYSGMMALAMQQQNFQNQNNILNNQLTAPKTPMGLIDDKYRQNKYGTTAGGGGQGGAGFGWNQPQYAPTEEDAPMQNEAPTPFYRG